MITDLIQGGNEAYCRGADSRTVLLRHPTVKTLTYPQFPSAYLLRLREPRQRNRLPIHCQRQSPIIPSHTESTPPPSLTATAPGDTTRIIGEALTLPPGIPPGLFAGTTTSP